MREMLALLASQKDIQQLRTIYKELFRMSLAIDKPYSNHESFKSANLGVDVEIKLNRKVLDSTLGFCYQLPY